MVVPQSLLSQAPSYLPEAEWVAPPAAAVCLTTPYASKPGQKGGTLLREGVRDLAEHRRLLSDLDGYRPDHCPRCGGCVFHAHDFRSRKLRDQPDSAEELIRRYRCTCSAVWQVLPGFLARHLHRTWGAVRSALVAAGALESTGTEWSVRRKPSTLRRWMGRLNSSALVLTQVFAAAGLTIFGRVGAWCTRGELVAELALAGAIEKPRQLEHLACWSHRLSPGLRLM